MRVVLGNLHTDDWWGDLDGEYDQVVNCVGASSPSLEGYRESYVAGMESIIGWLRLARSKASNLIFTSSTSVYPQTGGVLVDELSDTSGASARGQILLEAERSCLAHSRDFAMRSVVIRFSGLYGPGRHLLVDKIRRGEPMSGNPDRALNLLHRDDAVSALIEVMQADPLIEGGVFNACDGQHASRGEIVRWIADRFGAEVPEFIGAEEDDGPDRRVDGSKIRQVMKWVPKFPDFQSGYEDFLARE